MFRDGDDGRRGSHPGQGRILVHLRRQHGFVGKPLLHEKLLVILEVLRPADIETVASVGRQIRAGEDCSDLMRL
jgi:hypothetical protein